jgi:hypothetical protein
MLSLNDNLDEVFYEKWCLVLSENVLKYPEIEVNFKFKFTVRKMPCA